MRNDDRTENRFENLGRLFQRILYTEVGSVVGLSDFPKSSLPIMFGFVFLLASSAGAGILVSGSIHPHVLIRLPDNWPEAADPDLFSLPVRFAELGVVLSEGDFDAKVSAALEYRWTGNEHNLDLGDGRLDLREACLAWYPGFGEVRIGKQIIAWGAVDGNNPTDNISPYDYYYMFLPGAERKLGSLALDALFYFGDYQVEVVCIPEHVPNRLPFDEPDFPIAPPVNPSDDELASPSRPLEAGLRGRGAFGFGDVSLSWFRGHDRTFSALRKTLVPFEVCGLTFYGEMPDLYGYRRTTTWGADLVAFLPFDFTLRTEGALFRTSTEGNGNLPLAAWYSQYALQMEYSGVTDLMLTAQFLGNSVFSIEDTSEPLELDSLGLFPGKIIFRWDNEATFQPGTGMPFAAFTDAGLFLSSVYTCMDGSLELTGNGFFNLEDEGSMFGGGFVYSPVENLELELAVIIFSGPDADEPATPLETVNPFSALEDFSHVRTGIEYHF